ncbi:MAG: potassium channel family protein [Tepidisphaeraceae bacterium]
MHVVHTLALLLSLLLILTTLLEAFETILLPRRINRRVRFARLYYRGGWRFWRQAAALVRPGRWREMVLGIFGPLSMLGLFAAWIGSLIVGFAVLHWATDTPMSFGSHPLGPSSGLAPYLYFSGTTFFTLGLGDAVPINRLGRALTVLEGGLGFAFLAVIIGYLPVLYQAFSRREATISLLDARAGSPASGGEFVRRLATAGRLAQADATLREWETWCAELLESHISFPVLAFYRSQHANQSWLAALTTMLDACAILLSTRAGGDTYQTQLTFAMARHAAVDIALIFNIRPTPPTDRGDERIAALMRTIPASTILADSAIAAPPASAQFAELRAAYEPFLAGLSAYFLITLPPLLPAEATADNWQRSAWTARPKGIGSLSGQQADPSHFD